MYLISRIDRDGVDEHEGDDEDEDGWARQDGRVDRDGVGLGLLVDDRLRAQNGRNVWLKEKNQFNNKMATKVS